MYRSRFGVLILDVSVALRRLIFDAPLASLRALIVDASVTLRSSFLSRSLRFRALIWMNLLRFGAVTVDVSSVSLRGLNFDASVAPQSIELLMPRSRVGR